MARKNSSLGVVTAQGMVDVVDRKGRVVSSLPITPEKIIDLVELRDNPSQGAVHVTSLTMGATLTVGYTPEYAQGYEHAFGRDGRSRRESRN